VALLRTAYKLLWSRRRLVELLDAGAVDIEYEGIDRYGRPLARLRVNGEDVGAILIRERLAVPYHGRGPKMDWCPRRRR
jgi:micrococcal nuclease